MTNQSFAGKLSIKKLSAIVIAVVLLVTIFTGSAYAQTSDDYSVSIVDSTRTIAVTTSETEPIEILKQAGISLSAGDKLDITDFKESEGGSIVVNRIKTLYVEFEGAITAYQVYSCTVGEALEEIGITVKDDDKINYSLNTQIIDGMVLTVKAAEYVTLSADGTSTKYALTNGTVADLLANAGVVLGKDDYTEPSLDTRLTKDLTVKVKRVEYKTEEKTKTIAFKTKETKDSTLAQGKTKVVTKGEKGEDTITELVTYIDGQRVTSQEVSRVRTKEPVNEKKLIGTKSTRVNGGYNIKVSGRGFVWPAPACTFVSTPYGWRILRGYRDFHTGVDLTLPGGRSTGAVIVASLDGTVESVRRSNSGYGHCIVINHGGGVKTRYAHCLAGSISVSVGQHVSAGQAIARVGSTGNVTGPHLHFEITINGSTVNPLPYIR